MSNIVILKCDTKAKFEKMFNIFFKRLSVEGCLEDIELIVTENPCHYVPQNGSPEITQKSSFNS